uniref:DUF3456 domain-containing protein n=1 Tax=Panagrellus redivivus TaxID=6233 RepID=A0A7E4VC65_PANRE
MARETEARVSKLNPKMSKTDAAFWFNDYVDDFCRGLLALRVHHGVIGPARFSPEMSEIMKFAKRMRDQGTEVNIGLSEDLWDAPSVEISRLQSDCDAILEEHEEEIETWYYQRLKSGSDPPSLEATLCQSHFSTACSTSALSETPETEHDPNDEL